MEIGNETRRISALLTVVRSNAIAITRPLSMPPFPLCHVTHSNNLFYNFLEGFFLLGNSHGTKMYEIEIQKEDVRERGSYEKTQLRKAEIQTGKM
jgi:hypothetical protein